MHKKTIIVNNILWLISVLILFSCNEDLPTDTTQQNPSFSDKYNFEKEYELDFMLKEWALNFTNKIDSSYQAKIDFKIQASSEKYQLVI